jgi:hypothetical protein
MKNGVCLLDGEVQEDCTTNMKNVDYGCRLEVVDCCRNTFVGRVVGAVDRHKNRTYAVEELVAGEATD